MKILFVCLGNICRSPIAEGVAREWLRRAAPALAVEVDSAGTADYHLGEPPDERAQRAAEQRGIDISAHRARRVRRADFEHFDLLLAMDGANLAELRGQAPAAARDRVRLFLDFAPTVSVREVPDPYYGGPADFEAVLDLAEQGSQGLIEHLRERLRLTKPGPTTPGPPTTPGHDG